MSGQFLSVPALDHGPAWSEDTEMADPRARCALPSMNALSVRDYSGRSSRSVWGRLRVREGWEEGRVKEGGGHLGGP